MLLIRRIAVAALNAQLNVVPRVFQSVNQRQVQKTLILKYLKLKGMKKVGKNTDKLLRGATLMGKKLKTLISVLTHCLSVQFQQSMLLLFK